jgi:signal transduction histidine kinase
MPANAEHRVSGLHREDLYKRLGWLIRLRWRAVAGLLTTVLFARYVLALHPSVVHLLALNGALAMTNTVYWVLWRQWRDAAIRPLVRFAVVQTILDYVILTIVLHYSGGVENPLVITFVFHSIIASMLFSARVSYILAALSVLLVGTMVVLETMGLWPHHHLSGYLPSELSDNLPFLAGVLLTLVVVLFVSVYLTTTIEQASQRRRAEATKRSLELEDAREQVQQADKMAALGELAASMAHDINNPAGILCTRLEVMQAEGAFDNLPADLRRDLSTLQECAQYLRRVAENWTNFARKSRPNLEEVDLNEAVHRTASMVAESLPKYDIRLEMDLYPSALCVRGDLVRLQQMVLNLVNNARDAMVHGGILRIRTDLRPNSNRPPHAILEVEDTGNGIAPDDLAHIFDPFFSRKNQGEGTGLGLAICQKIVKEMDGAMEVRSQIGVGTTFAIRLPLFTASGRNAPHVRA